MCLSYGPVIICPAIELGLARYVAPEIGDSPIIGGLIEAIADVSYSELIVLIWAVAHHAGYLWRIHWELPHCARGAGVCYPIGQCLTCYPVGQDFIYPPIGQGVGECPIGLCDLEGPIGLRLREPPI
jgi:hypothetical protein